MKVSAILTIATLCLAGITVAAPISEPSASGIVEISKNGVENINFDYVSSSIEDMKERSRTEGFDSIEEEDVEFLDKLLQEIKIQGFLEEFLEEMESASQLGNDFKNSEDIYKSSDRVSEVFLNESLNTSENLGDSPESVVGIELSSEFKQSVNEWLKNSEAMMNPEKRQIEEKVDVKIEEIPKKKKRKAIKKLARDIACSLVVKTVLELIVECSFL